MPTIKLEINPEEFEKFAAEILERLRDAESQLESYRLLFAKSDSCADLDCELKAIREAVKTVSYTHLDVYKRQELY